MNVHNPNAFPEVVVCFVKLPVEPVVDDRVAEVVGEIQVHPSTIQTELKDQVQADVGEKVADGDSCEHLDDTRVFSSLSLDSWLFERITRASAGCASLKRI